MANTKNSTTKVTKPKATISKTEVVQKEENAVVENKNINNKNTNIDNKNVEMENKIKQLEEMNKVLMEKLELLVSQRQQIVEEPKRVVTEDLSPTRMIKVISLCVSELTLSQDQRGGGKVYKFQKLGSTRLIPANILEDIVSSHLSLAEKGYFYICDEKFVHDNGLESEYQNLVHPEVINTILSQDNYRLKEILNSCNLDQFKLILDTINEQIISGYVTINELEDDGRISVIDRCAKARLGNEDYSLKKIVEDIEYCKPKNV